MNGEPGERGRRGPRGPVGAPRLYGPLYGYILASLICTVVVYALLFQVRSENLASCHRVNDFRTEVNKRAEVINQMVMLERAELREHPHAGAHLHFVAEVPVTDCESAFPRPWPFSGIGSGS